ncbi:MAG: RagB/SusD family nutrient uptake outer membrane protein [Muribaculaceae bacterium]|nr:RagB/SusD family nutrient uptake outer membrane protein [Muribaculaceae bacterium]
MKSYINKSLLALALAFSLGMTTSCTGDLDQVPEDPNVTTAPQFDAEQVRQALAKCYAVLGVSGQDGPGSSDIKGLDNGTGQYMRALAMMNEYPTDELMWIYKDAGVVDLVTNTWGKDNVNIFGTYNRLYVHIAICNDFIRVIDGGCPGEPADLAQYRLEARALRALSYYWVIDVFGQGSFVDENTSGNPKQWSRIDLFNWLESELKDIIANYSTATPVYGRVGVDGVRALLARLYLNAKVYTGEERYADCQAQCEEIIKNHKDGLNGSGLVPHYMYVFCGDNDEYLPGGGGVNEILWGVPLDSEYAQSYGVTTFLSAASISNLTWQDNNAYMNQLDYGMGAQWGCMHARKEFSDKFTEGDARWSMWCKEDNGFIRENTDFSTFTNGYGVVKFTNLLKGVNGEWSPANGGIYSADPENPTAARSEAFSDSDYPVFRLADVYLMYAECNIVGNVGDAAKARTYVNYVRERAGVPAWSPEDMTSDNILDERCREMYWENTRRSDLIRFDKFTGSNYLWSWKNNILEGGSIPEHMKLFPIPSSVITAQPEFNQNPGY